MAYGLIDVAAANQQLEDLVVGNQVVGFETGDVWVLRLQDHARIIAFQRMSSSKEQPINQALGEAGVGLFEAADKEEISWATILASITRKAITAAMVDDDATLTLTFEGGSTIALKTDTDIVDWQWCITRNSPNPYIAEAELACFWRSEISSGGLA